MTKLGEIIPKDHPVRDLTRRGQIKLVKQAAKEDPAAAPTPGLSKDGLRVLTGFELQSLRMQHKLTQVQLSKKIGATYNVVSPVELDRRKFTPEEARRVEKYLKIPEGCCLPERGTEVAHKRKNRRIEPPVAPASSPLPSQAVSVPDSSPIPARIPQAPLSPIKGALLAEITTVIINPRLTDAQASRIHSLFNTVSVSVLLEG